MADGRKHQALRWHHPTASTAIVSRGDEFAIRPNAAGNGLEYSYDTGAWAALAGGGGGSVWNTIADPVGDQALAMGGYTSAWSWSTTTGGDANFTIEDTTTDNAGALVWIKTAASSQKMPLRVDAQAAEALVVDVNGRVGVGIGSSLLGKFHVAHSTTDAADHGIYAAATLTGSDAESSLSAAHFIGFTDSGTSLHSNGRAALHVQHTRTPEGDPEETGHLGYGVLSEMRYTAADGTLGALFAAFKSEVVVTAGGVLDTYVGYYATAPGLFADVNNKYGFIAEGGLYNGFGETNPAATLHVDGSARFDLGGDATGDMYYRAATTGLMTAVATSGASAGYVLTLAGTPLLPVWSAPAGSGSSKWNAITLPDGDHSLAMAAYTTTWTWGATTSTNNLFTVKNTSNDTGTGYLMTVETPGGTNAKSPLRVIAQGVEVMHVDPDGKFVWGSTSSAAALAVGTSAPLAVVANGSTGFAMLAAGTTNNAGRLHFFKATNTPSSPQVVAVNHLVGALEFNGHDGTNYIGAAGIQVFVDGTPSTNDMPGMMRFMTTADGASSFSQRGIVKSDGRWGFPSDVAGVFVAVSSNSNSLEGLRVTTNSGSATADAFSVYHDSVARVRFIPVAGKNTAAATVQVMNYVFGGVALNEDTTGGFVYISTVDAAPTTAPSASYTGTVALAYNTANNHLYGYNSGWQDLSSTSIKWNAVTLPDGDQSLTMAAYRTTWTWNATTSTNNLFTVKNTSNDTGTGFLLSLETPGGANAKSPLRISARGGDTFHVAPDGSFVWGSTSTPGALGIATSAPIYTVANGSTGLTMFSAGTTNLAPRLNFYKSSNTPTSPQVVAASHLLGALEFNAHDGTSFITTALIQAFIDGTPGTNDMPSMIRFSTTPDGSATSAVRMVIKNDGRVGIGTSTPAATLNVSGSVVFDITPGLDATGDIWYRNSGGLVTRLGAGTDGYVLKMASGLPSWAAASTGSPGGATTTVQYNNGGVFGGISGSSVSGADVTFSGTVAVSAAASYVSLSSTTGAIDGITYSNSVNGYFSLWRARSGGADVNAGDVLGGFAFVARVGGAWTTESTITVAYSSGASTMTISPSPSGSGTVLVTGRLAAQHGTTGLVRAHDSTVGSGHNLVVSHYGTTYGADADIYIRKSAGTIGSESNISSGASIGSIVWQGYLGGWSTCASIFVTHTTGNNLMVVTADTLSLTGGSANIALATAGVTVSLPGTNATGDIWYRNASGYMTRLAAGTNGHVLTLASGLPSWAAGSGGSPAGSGSEIQYRSSGVAFGAITSSSVSGANVTWAGNQAQVYTHTATSGTNSVYTQTITLSPASNSTAAHRLLDQSFAFGTAFNSGALRLRYSSNTHNQAGTITSFYADEAAYTNSAGTTTTAGGYTFTYNSGAGTTSQAVGYQSNLNVSAGTLTSATGFYATFDQSGGTYTTVTGFRMFTSGTIGTVYGIILPASFSGFGTASPTATIHLSGTAKLDLGSDATGDIWYRNSSGFVTRLGVGTNGHVLTLASGLPSWAAGGGGSPAGSGTEIQYRNAGSFGAVTSSVASTLITFTGYDFYFIRDAGLSFQTRSYGTGATSQWLLHSGRGTSAFPTATQSGDVIGNIHFSGQYDTTTTIASFNIGASIQAVAPANWDASNTPTDIIIKTKSGLGLSSITALRITSDQFVGVGSGIAHATIAAQFHVVGSVRFDLGSDAAGDTWYRSSNNFTRLAIGSSGTFYKSTGSAPSWSALAASDVTSGVFATARLGTGTANSSVFLRGDGTWASAGGGIGYQTILNEGGSLTQRATLNFIGAAVDAVDNSGSSRTDVTISAYTTILDEGSSLTARTAMNFSGNVVTASDDVVNSRTLIAITAIPTAGGSGSEIQYRTGSSALGAVTSSSVSGADVTWGGIQTQTLTNTSTSGTLSYDDQNLTISAASNSTATHRLRDIGVVWGTAVNTTSVQLTFADITHGQSGTVTSFYGSNLKYTNSAGTTSTVNGNFFQYDCTAGTTSQAIGYQSSLNANSGTLSNAIGYYATFDRSAGTLTSVTGFRMFTSGTIGTMYGLVVPIGTLNGLGVATPLYALDVAQTTSATTGLSVIAAYDYQSSGTPADGFGMSTLYRLQSTTTASRLAAQFDVNWQESTDASRSAVASVRTIHKGQTVALQRQLWGGYKALTDNTRTDIFTVTFAAADQLAAGGIVHLMVVAKQTSGSNQIQVYRKSISFIAIHNAATNTGSARWGTELTGDAVTSTGGITFTYECNTTAYPSYATTANTMTFQLTANSDLTTFADFFLMYNIEYNGEIEVALAA